MRAPGWRNGEEVTLPIDEEAYLAELNKKRATSRLKEDQDVGVAEMSNSFGDEKK